MTRIVPLLLLLAACSSPVPDPTVVTSDEDRQLNEAAAQLDANGIAADAPGSPQDNSR